jgi:hypothetical protein
MEIPRETPSPFKPDEFRNREVMRFNIEGLTPGK